MKYSWLVLAMALPAAAQDPDSKHKLEQRLKDLDEKYNRERARIKEEFERGPQEKPGAPQNPIEKRLADIERRLRVIEERSKGPAPQFGFDGPEQRKGPAPKSEWREVPGPQVRKNPGAELRKEPGPFGGKPGNERTFEFRFEGNPGQGWQQFARPPMEGPGANRPNQFKFEGPRMDRLMDIGKRFMERRGPEKPAQHDRIDEALEQLRRAIQEALHRR